MNSGRFSISHLALLHSVIGGYEKGRVLSLALKLASGSAKPSIQYSYRPMLRSFNRNEHPDEDYTFQEIQEEQIVILGHVFWWGMYAR